MSQTRRGMNLEAAKNFFFAYYRLALTGAQGVRSVSVDLQ